MIYFSLCALMLPTWQDLRKKEISRSIVFGLWGGLAVIAAMLYVNGFRQDWQMPVKMAAALFFSVLAGRYGKDKHIGRGDLLIILWLYAALHFDFWLKGFCLGLIFLWIWAIICKLRHQKERMPLLPFLWSGYLLALFV